MNLLEAIALGLVQGFTEFFPVSSSGHLVLAEALLGVNPPGVSFEVMVHLATLFSVLTVYRRRVVQLLVGTLRGKAAELRYVGLLVLGTVPAALAGTALKESISQIFDLPVLAAGALIVTGFVVYSTRWLLRRATQADPGWGGAFAVGVAQAVALIPGISRSGITVTTALFLHTRREAAAEFSFLLSVPAILGASLLELPDLAGSSATVGVPQLAAAALSAFAAGLVAIVLFVRWLRTGSFHRFAYYCWGVAGAYLIYALVSGAA
ncbi:MAG: undecaprenyl-diphosphate phosphatase [Gemmatimonadota bacterium]|nr:MAG: undecaprenyl-diphosphate phosphatase [Gemmatimonadota bacterium]